MKKWSPSRQMVFRELFERNWFKIRITDFDVPGARVVVRDAQGRSVVRRDQSRRTLREMARLAARRDLRRLADVP